jgi:hypothetical protein
VVEGSSAIELDAVVVSDPDEYTEVHDWSGGDAFDFGRVSAVVFSDRRWPPPAGVPRADTYRFGGDPNAALRAGFGAEAEAAAEVAWDSHFYGAVRPTRFLVPRAEVLRLRTAGPVAATGAAAAAAATPELTAQQREDLVRDWAWVATETVKSGGVDVITRGTELIQSDRWLTRGVKALAEVTAADGSRHDVTMCRVKRTELTTYLQGTGDARLLPIAARDGRRVPRLWREVCDAARVSVFEDWDVPGPRTVRWCIDFINRRGGGPEDHHKWWKTSNRLFDDQWGVAEHGAVMKSLRHAGCLDQLDLTNLASIEVLMRRAQLIEYTYSDRGPAAMPEKADATEDSEKAKKSKGGKGGRKGGS